jgi:hypothetical protein
MDTATFNKGLSVRNCRRLSQSTMGRTKKEVRGGWVSEVVGASVLRRELPVGVVYGAEKPVSARATHSRSSA